MMALRNSGFSAGERLELAYLREWGTPQGDFPSVCLAVEGNSNVRQDSTNVIVWDCEASRGKTWALDGSQSHGSHFQIKYTGPTQESFDLCVAGQTPGGSRDFGEGSQFYLWRCMPNDPTQQFQFVGARHPSRTGGRAVSWRQNPKYCLDAEDFSNGDKAIAYKCTEDLLDHQIWAVL